MDPIHTISVLGGGWLGLPLSKKLIESGYQVKISVTSPEKRDLLINQGLNAFWVEIHKEVGGEPKDFFDSELLIINVPPSKVGRGANDFHLLVENCIEAIHEFEIKYLLFISSTSVYGNTNSIVTEKTVCSPETLNGKVLVEAERMLKQLTSVKTTIVRYGGLAGADRNMLRSILNKNRKVQLEAPVNLIHLEDSIAIVLKIVEKGLWGYSFNACADAHPTRRELYGQIAKKAGLEMPLESLQKPSYKIVGNKYLKEKLGYQFKYPDPLEMFT